MVHIPSMIWPVTLWMTSSGGWTSIVMTYLLSFFAEDKNEHNFLSYGRLTEGAGLSSNGYGLLRHQRRELYRQFRGLGIVDIPPKGVDWTVFRWARKSECSLHFVFLKVFNRKSQDKKVALTSLYTWRAGHEWYVWRALRFGGWVFANNRTRIGLSPAEPSE